MAQAIPPLSVRAAAMEPFRVMQILAEAQALEAGGTDVIHLEVGEPDFATPDAIVAAGQRALATGVTRYTAAHGTAALRAAIADDYRRLHGLEIDRERVIVTAGASAPTLWAGAGGGAFFGAAVGALAGLLVAPTMVSSWERTFAPLVPGAVAVGVRCANERSARRAERVLRVSGAHTIRRVADLDALPPGPLDPASLEDPFGPVAGAG